jgi:hypothetical protein
MSEKRLLLLGGSRTKPGDQPYEHALEHIAKFLGSARHLWVIPYAKPPQQWEQTIDNIARYLSPITSVVPSIIDDHPTENIDAIFVPGGNTAALSHHLSRSTFGPNIRNLVNAGVPYIGSHAGAEIAGTHLDVALNDPHTTRKGLELVSASIKAGYRNEERGAGNSMYEHIEEVLLHASERSSLQFMEPRTVIALYSDTILRLESGKPLIAGGTEPERIDKETIIRDPRERK